MYDPDVFLNLVDFELVAAVPDGGVVVLLLALVLRRAIEKLEPVQLLVVLPEVLAEADRFLLAYPQLHADPLDQFRGRYLLTSEEIPHEGHLADDDFHVTIAQAPVFLVVQVVETQPHFLLEAAVVYLVQKLHEVFAGALGRSAGT